MAVTSKDSRETSLFNTINVVCGNRPPNTTGLNFRNSADMRNLINVPIIEYNMPRIILTNPRSICNKMDELSVLVKEHQPDIVCITESWCREDIPDEALNTAGYVNFRKDRTEKPGGGILCMIRNNIMVKHWNELEVPNIESLWLTIFPKHMPRKFSGILLGIIYHPPLANDKELYNHMCTSIDKILQKHPNIGIMVVGDFNHFNEHYFRSTYRLKQIVAKPTHDKGRILDKVFTTMADLFEEPQILPPLGLSDHFVVHITPSALTSKIKGKIEKVLVRSSDPNGKAFFVQALKDTN